MHIIACMFTFLDAVACLLVHAAASSSFQYTTSGYYGFDAAAAAAAADTAVDACPQCVGFDWIILVFLFGIIATEHSMRFIHVCAHLIRIIIIVSFHEDTSLRANDMGA